MSTGYRLPTTVIPKAYGIDLDASPRRKSFSGKVTIEVKVTERGTVQITPKGKEAFEKGKSDTQRVDARSGLVGLSRG